MGSSAPNPHQPPHPPHPHSQPPEEEEVGALTIAAVRASIGRHGAVTGKALPLLETHALIVAGVLHAGRTGACRGTNTHTFTHTFTHSLTHALTKALTHALTHSLKHALTHPSSLAEP